MYIDTDYSPYNNCDTHCKNIYWSFQQWVEILDIIITPIKQHISSKKNDPQKRSHYSIKWIK